MEHENSLPEKIEQTEYRDQKLKISMMRTKFTSIWTVLPEKPPEKVTKNIMVLSTVRFVTRSVKNKPKMVPKGPGWQKVPKCPRLAKCI